ncbi:hypothetical protein PDJAM_G00005200 [Pangasius djambal]|uniref:Uncharacterized protein n=1 Tax=Pangasius djambal TaxID=1691987 RepID=A0ACC5XYT2_9TELE|nr:hypothetical protein [Pangasius djambal]
MFTWPFSLRQEAVVVALQHSRMQLLLLEVHTVSLLQSSIQLAVQVVTVTASVFFSYEGKRVMKFYKMYFWLLTLK